MIKLLHSDDCGLNKESTDAICIALESGRINSTSILFGAESTEYAVEKLCKIPDAIVGVHLNLLEGRCCAPVYEVSSLVDENGFFKLSLGKLLFRGGIKDKNLIGQVYKEFRAQIDCFKKYFPDKEVRIDGHLHVHCVPYFNKVMDVIFSEYKVSYVRTPFEANYGTGICGVNLARALFRRKLLNIWSRRMRRILLNRNIPTADFFIGSALSVQMNFDYIYNALNLIDENAEDIVEIMLHLSLPEYSSSDKTWYVNDYRNAHYLESRVEEFNMVMSPKFDEILNF